MDYYITKRLYHATQYELSLPGDSFRQILQKWKNFYAAKKHIKRKLHKNTKNCKAKIVQNY